MSIAQTHRRGSTSWSTHSAGPRTSPPSLASLTRDWRDHHKVDLRSVILWIFCTLKKDLKRPKNRSNIAILPIPTQPVRGEEQRTAVDEGQLDVQPGRRCPDGRQGRVGDKVRFSSCDSTVNINLNFDKKLDSKFWIHATYPCNLY